MRTFGRKLRSTRGASISFALLLFLVCTMVSTVVIVAGTTAAGRMSGVVETDQRYYAVNSAAELIKKLINDKTSDVVVETITETTRRHYDEPGTDDRKTIETLTPSTTVNTRYKGLFYKTVGSDAESSDEEKEKIAKDLLADASFALNHSGEADKPALSLKNIPAGVGASSTVLYYNSFLISVNASDDIRKAVEANVFELLTVMPNDEITLDFYISKKKTNNDADARAYTLRMTFVPDKQTVTDELTEYGAPVGTGEYHEHEVGGVKIPCPIYTVTETKTVTETTTYDWELVGITNEERIPSVGGGST